jgi:hypothetical protein
MHDPTSQQIACMAAEEEEMMQLVDLDEKLIDRHLSPGTTPDHYNTAGSKSPFSAGF